MTESDVFSEEYRQCICKCINKHRLQKEIERLGYHIDEMINEIIAHTWASFLNKKSLEYSFGTIAENQLKWTILKLKQKPLPPIYVKPHYDHVMELDNHEHVNLLLRHKSLSTHERMVLKARFIKEQTLEAIAFELCVSKERVRQLQEKGLKKLRDLSNNT